MCCCYKSPRSFSSSCFELWKMGFLKTKFKTEIKEKTVIRTNRVSFWNRKTTLTRLILERGSYSVILTSFIFRECAINCTITPANNFKILNCPNFCLPNSSWSLSWESNIPKEHYKRRSVFSELVLGHAIPYLIDLDKLKRFYYWEFFSIEQK